ncbi:MAG: exodeoxyribonuclease VII large subunit [Azospirillaceae bacterium]
MPAPAPFDAPIPTADTRGAGSQGGGPGSNLPEYSVGEIAFSVKRTLEETYGHIRVRGEISRPKVPGSGHLYLTLKDDRAVLDAVCWRNTRSKLAISPEEGMEVIATGRMTTYPGGSRYQLVIEQLELAGEGALLKMLEERRKRLAEEGLFDEARKVPLPFIPEVVGVVTSPTGAVIRDILHRLAERFPRRVLLWPVRVQGETAAEEVAAAIRGFNALPPGGPIPRPDVLIVARGGGSLEDLMAFNEESVVRAAADSAIPLISAVGHETDTTLIDFAADRRAPTPTAAAEIAVPVRADLIAQVLDIERRRIGAMARGLEHRRVRLDGLARGLGDPVRLLEGWWQRLDDRGERLDRAMRVRVDRDRARLAEAAARLPHPRQRMLQAGRNLDQLAGRLDAGARQAVALQRRLFRPVAERLSPAPIARLAADGRRRLDDQARRLGTAEARVVDHAHRRLAAQAQLLESYSHEAVLRRGFALVLDAEGRRAITRAADATEGRRVALRFTDGEAPAVIGGGGGADAPSPPKPARKRAPAPAKQSQPKLL